MLDCSQLSRNALVDINLSLISDYRSTDCLNPYSTDMRSNVHLYEIFMCSI